MDRSKFTSCSPGELVLITRHDSPTRKDWAFVPAELPVKWTFDPLLWPLLADARDRLGTLNGIGQTLDDPDLLLQPLQSREAIKSSEIEGTTVTPEQYLLFELDPREPQSPSEESANWLEVLNYNVALKTGCKMVAERPISSHIIRSMHAELMRGVRGRDKAPGQFRRKQVQIGSNARYIAPPCAEVDRLMQNLDSYIATDEVEVDPLIKCFVAHYQFEAVHPFEDGNGRVGRALLALMVYKLFDHKRPWLYLSAFFDRFQDEYFDNLFRVSATGDWNRWIEFCLHATVAQANDAIRRCDQFRALKAAFHTRLTSPSPRSHKLIDALFKSPVVRVTNVKRLFNVHYQTAQADIDRLVAVGILRPLRVLRPKTYYAPEIMAIAHDLDEAAS